MYISYYKKHVSTASGLFWLNFFRGLQLAENFWKKSFQATPAFTIVSFVATKNIDFHRSDSSNVNLSFRVLLVLYPP